MGDAPANYFTALSPPPPPTVSLTDHLHCNPTLYLTDLPQLTCPFTSSTYPTVYLIDLLQFPLPLPYRLTPPPFTLPFTLSSYLSSLYRYLIELPYRLPYRLTPVSFTVYLTYYCHNHLPIIVCPRHAPSVLYNHLPKVLPYVQIITIDLPVVISIAHLTWPYYRL